MEYSDSDSDSDVPESLSSLKPGAGTQPRRDAQHVQAKRVDVSRINLNYLVSCILVPVVHVYIPGM